jgi:hypothetical protein
MCIDGKDDHANNAQLDEKTPMIDGFIEDPMVHENLEIIPQKRLMCHWWMFW